MGELDRPSWCPDPDCACLTSYCDASPSGFCTGRLPKKIAHDELFNTHNMCLDGDTQIPINEADAYYLTRCMQKVREDVQQHKLYSPPGRGDTWDFERK